MRIAVAQMNTRAGDFAATVDAMGLYGERAAAAGADLLVYPAPALMGPDPMGLSEREGYVFDVTEALGKLAERLRVPALVPFMMGLGANPGVDVAYVRDGTVLPVVLASWLGALGSAVPDGDSARAKSAYAPAQLPFGRPARISVDGVDVGLALSFEDLDAFASGDVSADIICHIPVDGFDTDDVATCLAPSVSDGCFTQDASDANSWLVAAGAVGGYEDSVYAGGSFVMAPWGELAAVAPSFVEDLLVCDIDVMGEGPLADPVDAHSFDRERMLWDACSLALRDQVDKRGLAGVTLAVDGGLGTAALASLAVDAVGPLRVSALVCAEGDALKDARELVRALRIRDVDELSVRDLARAADLVGGDVDTDALGRGLVRARLFAQAASEGRLALSAADKTELAVGASGEPVATAGAFAPFGDVYRSDVARLARRRNMVSSVIPAGSLARIRVPEGLGLEEVAASDELRVGELDAMLLMHVERGLGLAGLSAGKLGSEGARRLLARIKGNEAVRRSGPRYPIVSACSFAELASPVTDAWVDHERDLADDPRADEIADALRELAGEASSAEESPLEDALDPERVSEVMGYLKDLSDGRRLRSEASGEGEGNDGASGGDGLWPSGMFSDN